MSQNPKKQSEIEQLQPWDLVRKMHLDVKIPVLPAGPVEEALDEARVDGDIVIVAGSVFLAGAVRELVGR